MIFFIRNQRNENIVDCELYNTDEHGYNHTELSVTVMLDTYSELLLSSQDPKKLVDIIKIFLYIQSLRSWLWETYYSSKENRGEDLDDIAEKISTFFKEVADKFDLIYVED